MQKKCGAKTKNGGACKAWAMANGFCQRHGGKKLTAKKPTAPPKLLEPENEEVIQKDESLPHMKDILTDCFKLSIKLSTLIVRRIFDVLLPNNYSDKKK